MSEIDDCYLKIILPEPEKFRYLCHFDKKIWPYLNCYNRKVNSKKKDKE